MKHIAAFIGALLLALSFEAGGQLAMTGAGKKPAAAGSTIVHDATATDALETTATATWTHTTGSGSNRVLIVACKGRDSTSINDVRATSVTYGAANLTEATWLGAGVYSSNIWYLVAPATGADTVTVNFTAAPNNAVCSSSSYTGVDQTTPIDASNTASGTGTSASVTVTVVTDQAMLVDAMSHGESPANLSPDSPQTQRSEGGFVETYGTSDKTVGTGSQSASWTSTASDTWTTSAVALKPAP